MLKMNRLAKFAAALLVERGTAFDKNHHAIYASYN